MDDSLSKVGADMAVADRKGRDQAAQTGDQKPPDQAGQTRDQKAPD